MFLVDFIAPQVSTVSTGPRETNIPELKEKGVYHLPEGFLGL